MRHQMGLLVCALFTVMVAFTNAQGCQDVERVFNSMRESNDSNICNCLYGGVFADVSQMSVECSETSISQIFASFQALNSTKLGMLTIRDSLANVLPSNIFENVHPEIISIDRCSLAVIRENTLDAVGEELTTLSMRENKLKKIDGQMLRGLKHLQSFDASGNRISSIDAEAFKDCGEMTELVLNNNELAEIEGGVFKFMPKLRSLSLIANRITTIAKDAFEGLDQLEVLQLQENEIMNIDWSAFSRLKKLKYLNIGSNHVAFVDVRGLNSLQKLLLNNNSIDTLKSVKLRDLPSLTILSVDRNRITSIGDMDLFGLSKSTRLESISLASNNITVIGPRAFNSVQNLQALSLQNNQIRDLSSNGTAYLSPLKKLASLQLSANELSTIRALELPKSLVTLAVDHNQISRIEPRAFDGMKLKRIYLNKNKLKFLYQNAFESFPPESIEAIDVSSNAWQCACKDPNEWLPRWLEEAEDSDVSEGPLGCLVIPGCGKEATTEPKEEDEGSRSIWITVAASILAMLSLMILMVIAYVYFKDYGYQLTRSHRANSDLHRLIDNDPLNLSTEPVYLVAPILKQPTQIGEKKKSVRFEDH